MTSMLLSVSMGALRPAPSPYPLPREGERGMRRRGLFSGLDVLGQDVPVGLVPLGGLHELAALDGEDLDPAATLVVVDRDLERRHEPAEREALDLLEARLDVRARDGAARLGLQRVADRLHV